jgi:large repetitive protein
VGVKRFLLTAVLVVAASVVFVPGASAGNFDEEKMSCTGENPATCPAGQVGKPYSLTIYLVPPDGGRGEDFGCATFHPAAGFPPGLSISDEGVIHGTPTQAGNFDVYLTVKYDKEPGCFKVSSDDRFIFPIHPEVPRLILQPEQAGVPISTVGSPYQLQMTSNLPDAKTWSLASGDLPTGLNLDASSGLISGTPTAPGTYNFTVSAVLASDPLANPARSDTKALQIVVRPALVIAAGEPFISGSATKWEVGIPFDATFTATGGNETYTWALVGTLPSGLTFDATAGTISGTPRRAGVSRFGVTATDSEGRVATYDARLTVAARLTIVPQRLPLGFVGKRYKARLRTTGGVLPRTIRITHGPIPRGIRFNRTTGVLAGIPTKPGVYLIDVEATDALDVTSTRTFRIVVRAAAKRR